METEGAEKRTRGGDSLGIACGHQMFTCNKKKGEGVVGKKGEEKKAVVYRRGRGRKA